jgi:hypothetical protein
VRKLGGVLLAGVGVALALLGLLFLVAASGQPRRLLVAVMALGLGGVLIGLGVRIVRTAAALSPERIRAQILELARQRSGEISASDVEAAVGRGTAVAETVLDALVREGRCSRHLRGGRDYWVFEGLQPRLVGRFCRYCETEVPLAEEGDSCPSCGGDLETRVSAHSLSRGEVYHMDE